MPPKRVTMQNIADACGLSRNTVSKVFNGRGSVPQSTRELVLQKARVLGYGSPLQEEFEPPENAGHIALLTRFLPDQFHFGSLFMSSFTDQLSRAGYTMKVFVISPEEFEGQQLPPHFIPEQTAGIVGLELFDQKYVDMLCRLGIPMVLTDSPTEAGTSLMECDYVTMENTAGIIALVDRLAAAGARRIGFVGDVAHCGSFKERWIGFQLGMQRNGLKLDQRFCICEPDASPYDDSAWLFSRFDQMPSLPDAFVCANDYLAIHLMLSLKKKGLSIPKDIMITGFDGTSQSAFTDPPLTTVQIYSTETGHMAANILLNRIRNNSFPFTWTRVKTTPVWRESIRLV
ncbi:MAG: LacI family DNA-binding transcriptional regulator [Clostridia bacterium]|nr:LacI family DNA-binding transcriptional regulator [Clostridia bacterium]